MDFEREAAAFRAAVRQAGPRVVRQRYKAAVKRQGVAYLSARRASGTTASAAARESAVRRDTLLLWTRPGSGLVKAIDYMLGMWGGLVPSW